MSRSFVHSHQGHHRIHPDLEAVVKRCDAIEITMGTKGEIEAAICEGISRFEQEYMGRGPKDIHAHLVIDIVLVRLQGVLTAAEQHLVKSQSPETGRDLALQSQTGKNQRSDCFDGS